MLGGRVSEKQSLERRPAKQCRIDSLQGRVTVPQSGTIATLPMRAACRVFFTRGYLRVSLCGILPNCKRPAFLDVFLIYPLLLPSEGGLRKQAPLVTWHRRTWQAAPLGAHQSDTRALYSLIDSTVPIISTYLFTTCNIQHRHPPKHIAPVVVGKGIAKAYSMIRMRCLTFLLACECIYSMDKIREIATCHSLEFSLQLCRVV